MFAFTLMNGFVFIAASFALNPSAVSVEWVRYLHFFALMGTVSSGGLTCQDALWMAMGSWGLRLNVGARL